MGNGPEDQSQAHTVRPQRNPPRGGARMWRDVRISTERVRKNTKATVKIASLNMRGFGGRTVYAPDNKWQHIAQIIRQQRIGILTLQETHLDQERANSVNRLFDRQMVVLNSQDPRNPTGAAGIAFVLNKQFVSVHQDDVDAKVILDGRAALLIIKIHRTETKAILAVYAPNDPQENAEFWRTIRRYFEEHPGTPKPDVMMGDFNMVEDEMDRMPRHTDSGDSTDALDDLKISLQLIDGWRDTYPDKRAFTLFQKATGAQSRIDRIYVKASDKQSAFEWRHDVAGIRTDHKMVSVRISSEDAPEIGKGRWTWPTHLLEDRELTKFIDDEGRELQRKICGPANGEERNEQEQGVTGTDNNPQVLWKEFKDKIQKKARERAKIVIPKIDRKIQEIRSKLESILEDTLISDSEKSLTSAMLTEKLIELEVSRHRSSRVATRARNQIEGEVIGKYWSAINKPRRPREVIQRLIQPRNSAVGMQERPADEHRPEYEKNSRKMANIARDYHNKLQNVDLLPGSEQGQEGEEDSHRRQTVTERIRAKVKWEEAEKLSRRLSYDEIANALRLSGNGKAPGLDGIPYEVWKRLAARFEAASKQTRDGDSTGRTPTPFDLIAVLTTVYNDIEQNGVQNGTGFAESWMCPLYKKNDRADIANYRPISLLNSDYKIMSKALAIRLAEVAPSLIHQNQAGFVPGRHIHDQIWLSKRVIELAEAEERNGVIVALDQEKAYDRIHHEYLWKVLEGFGFPLQYISTVKTLYSDANTHVIINGVMSDSPFRVTRGVRQGDPLSCLLFDLAIEPLAEALRQSNLKGFRIPGMEERLIATLFADDTTTYLSEEDNFQSLTDILDEWCIASGAKFNIAKTEVIPVGSKIYRDKVRRTRGINDTSNASIPAYVRIANEGEAIRSLGAWIGNDICQVEAWSRTLEKIDEKLNQWEKGHPTLEGRRLIVQMVVGGMTQYLTRVQGMPKHTEEQIKKRINSFIWAGCSPKVNREILHMDIEKGGRRVLDIEARNEAIWVMWLKGYLSGRGSRPMWAYVADELLKVTTESDNTPRDVKVNTFLQSWNLHDKLLPEDLRKMVKVGKKYGVRPDGIAVGKEILNEMPLWFHFTSQATRVSERGRNGCLKHNHGISKVGEAVALMNGLECKDHKPWRTCKCTYCKCARDQTKDLEEECTNPHKCMMKAKELIMSLPQKWNPNLVRADDNDAIERPPDTSERHKMFLRKITIHGDIAETFRIFTEGEPSMVSHVMAWNEGEATQEVYTDGSCHGGGSSAPKAGSGIYFGEDDVRNTSKRVPEEVGPSNQTAEILAAKNAADIADPNAPLHILSDSMHVVKGLTERLTEWEDTGWAGVANRTAMKHAVASLRMRRAPTSFEWVKGHSGIKGNEEADRLAEEGCRATPMQLEEIPGTLNLTGAKLTRMTQALAYKLIRETKERKTQTRKALERRKTELCVARIQDTFESDGRETPSPKKIWTALRNKVLNILLNIRYKSPSGTR